MKVFIVAFAPSVQDSKKVIQEKFNEFHFEILENFIWAVGVPKRTTTGADVCSTLGINSEGDRAGVVWPLTNYYGYFDQALWQKLDAWQAYESTE